MDVLVDTSVWIRFLSNREPYAHRRTAVLAAYDVLPHATVISHREVVEFARAHGLAGRGIGWIDVQLLASALVDRLQFWTADQRLEAITNELGIRFLVES